MSPFSTFPQPASALPPAIADMPAAEPDKPSPSALYNTPLFIPQETVAYKAAWQATRASELSVRYSHPHHPDWKLYTIQLMKNLVPVREIHGGAWNGLWPQYWDTEKLASAQSFIEDLPQSVGWDLFRMKVQQQPSQAAQHETLLKTLIDQWYSVHRVPVGYTYLIDQLCPVDKWYEHLSYNPRKNLRRFLRRAQKEGLQFTVTDTVTPDMIERFIQNHITYWSHYGQSFLETPSEQAFLRHLISQTTHADNNSALRCRMASLSFHDNPPVFDMLLLTQGSELNAFMISQAPGHAFRKHCLGGIIFPLLIDWAQKQTPAFQRLTLAVGTPTEWVRRTATDRWSLEEWIVVNPKASLLTKLTLPLLIRHLQKVGHESMNACLYFGKLTSKQANPRVASFPALPEQTTPSSLDDDDTPTAEPEATT